MYRARTPSELCGHHLELIEQALGGNEPEYLLYTPLRETDRGPFQFEGQSGSHALALTKSSLIVSRDPHRSDVARTVCRIPLTNIVTLCLGEALTLGWLVVRFVNSGEIEQEVVFFQSSGSTHFRDLVRLWIGHLSSRRGACPGVTRCQTDGSPSPAYLSGQLDPLIAGVDHVDVFHAPEAWAGVNGKHRCRCASTSVAVSSSCVLLAESERPLRPGTLMFGVNVICLPRRVLAYVRLDLPEDSDSAVSSLTMAMSIYGVGDHVRREFAMTRVSACRLLARLGSRAINEGAA